MVVVGIIIVSMTVIMPGGSFAKPTLGVGVVMVCRISPSAYM